MFSKVHAANRKYTDVIVSIKIPQLLREVKLFLQQGFRIIKRSRPFQGNLRVYRIIVVCDKAAVALLLPHPKSQPA